MAIAVAPSGGLWAKGREPQIILKTDERDLVLELGAMVKFVVKSSSWEKKMTSLRSQSRAAAW